MCPADVPDMMTCGVPLPHVRCLVPSHRYVPPSCRSRYSPPEMLGDARRLRLSTAPQDCGHATRSEPADRMPRQISRYPASCTSLARGRDEGDAPWLHPELASPGAANREGLKGNGTEVRTSCGKCRKSSLDGWMHGCMDGWTSGRMDGVEEMEVDLLW